MKKWAEVEASPSYMGMTPEQRSMAKEQYFAQVVAPQVPPDKVELAKSQFFGEGAQAPQPAALEAPGILDRAWGGLVNAMPGSGIRSYKRGERGADLASAISQDVAQIAMLGAAGRAGGLPLLAKAAGANAALGAATGAIEPVITASGKAGRAVGETLNPLAWLPKNSTSVPLNMLRETAGTVGETAGELAPSALMMLLGGKLAKKATTPSPEIAPDVQARASFGAKEGIPLTKGELAGKNSPAMMKEAALRRSSGGAAPAEQMAQSQQAAVREALAKRAAGLGDDTLGAEIRSGQFTEGRQLADVPEAAKALRAERGAAVGAAKEALATEIPIRSNFAKELRGEMKAAISKLKDAGPGSDRAKARQLLEGYLEHAGNVKTMGSAIRFLDDFDSAINDVMSKSKPDVKKVAFGSTRSKISSLLDEAGANLAPEQQANLKTAKAGFAEIADPALDLGRGLQETNPAALLRSITSGNKSIAKVQGFNKVFEPGSQQRQGLQSAVLQDLVKRSTLKEGVSGNALMKALDKYDQATLNEVFSDKGALLQDLRDFSKKLADVENQRTPLGVVTSGNSITEAAMRLGKRLALDKVTMGLGPLLMDAVDKAKAKRAFLPASPQAPSRGVIPYMPWLGGVSPGTPALAGAATLGTAQAIR